MFFLIAILHHVIDDFLAKFALVQSPCRCHNDTFNAIYHVVSSIHSTISISKSLAVLLSVRFLKQRQTLQSSFNHFFRHALVDPKLREVAQII